MKISGILGHPLKNPRSVKIWKNYFKKKKILSRMLKFDVKPKKLKDFIKFIRAEKNFKATAVTMPYKKKIIKFLDKIDDFAMKAGSVNLIIKTNGVLTGYNTDVYGAYYPIKNQIKSYEKIIIIGLGGTGEAIFNFLSSKFKNKKYLLISSKFKYKKNLKVKVKKKIPKKTLINDKNFIINCTPLGSNLKKNFIKKLPIETELLKKVKKTSFILDIIYSPEKTKLSIECKKNKLKYMNGIKMNTLQAERALKLAFRK